MPLDLSLHRTKTPCCGSKTAVSQALRRSSAGARNGARVFTFFCFLEVEFQLQKAPSNRSSPIKPSPPSHHPIYGANSASLAAKSRAPVAPSTPALELTPAVERAVPGRHVGRVGRRAGAAGEDHHFAAGGGVAGAGVEASPGGCLPRTVAGVRMGVRMGGGGLSRYSSSTLRNRSIWRAPQSASATLRKRGSPA